MNRLRVLSLLILNIQSLIQSPMQSQRLPMIRFSESESGTCATSPLNFGFVSGNGIIKLEEGNKEFNLIKNKFIRGMGPIRSHTMVVAVHKISHCSFQGQARLQSFRIFLEATTPKCNGTANVRCAWYGTSRDGINRIISHGFGPCEKLETMWCMVVAYIFLPNFFLLTGMKEIIRVSIIFLACLMQMHVWVAYLIYMDSLFFILLKWKSF